MSKPTMRQSTITSFKKCGKYYYFNNIAKLPSLNPPKMLLGTVLDAVNNANLLSKKTTGVDLSAEELKELAVNIVESRRNEANWNADKELPNADVMKDHSVKLVETYLTHVAPTIDPLEVQAHFRIETDLEYDFEGTIDVIDKNGMVRDLKVTTSKSVRFYSLESSIQAALYTYAYKNHYKKDPVGFQFDLMVRATKTKPSKYEATAGQVTDDQINVMFEMAQEVHEDIRDGRFRMTSDMTWWCKADACPFWNQCKGKKLK